MKKENNSKRSLFVSLGLFVGLGCLVYLMKWLLPVYYTHYLLLVPAYFLLISAGLVLLFSRLRRTQQHPRREIALSMLSNVGLMVLSLVLLFCYFKFIQIQKNAMLLVFCIFYLVFMRAKFHIMLNFNPSEKSIQNEEKKV